MEGALGTRGGPGGGATALHFQLPPSTSQLMSVPLSPRSREQRPLSSLPCCRCVAPAVVIGRRLVTACSVHSGERGDLFPHSVSNRSASHLFLVSSLGSCLFCLSSSCCWHIAPVGAGGDQAVLPGTPAPGISSLPGRSWRPGEGIVRLPLCLPSKNQHAVAWPPSIHLPCQGLAHRFGPGSSSSVVPYGRDWGPQTLCGQGSNDSVGQARCERWEM